MTEGTGLSLRQLRYFVGAARTLSLMKASHSLHVSQPALSLQIKRLEVCLGTSLFERQARGLKLTAAGTVFLAHAIDVLEAVKMAERSVSSHRDHAHPVALGLTPTIGRALVGDLLNGASSGVVALKLSLREALSDELAALFRAGELDAVLCYDQKPDTSTEMIPLYAEPLHLVGPPSDLFSGHSPLPVEQLSKFPLALAPSDHASRQVIERTAATAGVSLDVRLEITPASLKRELLIKHRFYTIVPFGLFLPEVQAGQLVAVPLSPEIVRTMSLLMSKNLSPHIRRRLAEFTKAAVDATIAKQGFRWQPLNRDSAPP